ncbi:hypothetical protein F5Y04DRAFT_102768 [Hypomontagnella monticulosa]|nr:hypothetical protein F5Y04DRAFT_102768 [Hypomontagnella monticulosa]
MVTSAGLLLYKKKKKEVRSRPRKQCRINKTNETKLPELAHQWTKRPKCLRLIHGLGRMRPLLPTSRHPLKHLGFEIHATSTEQHTNLYRLYYNSWFQVSIACGAPLVGRIVIAFFPLFLRRFPVMPRHATCMSRLWTYGQMPLTTSAVNGKWQIGNLGRAS